MSQLKPMSNSITGVKKDKWISILDEEPRAGQGVLVALSSGFISIGYRALKKNSHNWQLFAPLEALDVDSSDYVTHWMPLPEPPAFIKNKYNEEELRELYQYPSHWRKDKKTKLKNHE